MCVNSGGVRSSTTRPADGIWAGDGDFLFGALGLGMSRTGRIGTAIELAGQLHRTVQHMEPTVAVIADVHQPSTDRAVAVEDVEFPQGEIRISGHR